MDRRILVAQAPSRIPFKPKPCPVPCRVGVMPWVFEQKQWLTVIVKTTLRFDDDVPTDKELGHRLALYLEPSRQLTVTNSTLRQPPPTNGEPPPEARVGDEIVAASDFVPRKAKPELLVVGSAPVAKSASGMNVPPPSPVGIDIDGWQRAAHAHARAGERIPLTSRHLVGMDGSQGLRWGPLRQAWDDEADAVLGEEFDFEACQAAHPDSRRDFISSGAVITLAGLGQEVGEAALRFELPGFKPRVLIDWSHTYRDPLELRMVLDTMAIYTDAKLIELTHRGDCRVDYLDCRDVDRIIVGFMPDRLWQSDEQDERWRPVLRELPRGDFFYATTKDDVRNGEEPPPVPEEELAMARYETWDQPDAPIPQLPMDKYAFITAEIAEQREPKERILEKHGLSDYEWSLEERGWMGLLADTPIDGGRPTTASEDFAAHFLKAQEELASPDEQNLTMKEYVEITVELERDPRGAALSSRGLSPGAFMRLERRIEKLAKDDSKEAEKLKKLFAEERSRPEAAPTDPESELNERAEKLIRDDEGAP